MSKTISETFVKNFILTFEKTYEPRGITSGELAQVFGLPERTIRNWVATAGIKPVGGLGGPRGRHILHLHDIKTVIEENYNFIVHRSKKKAEIEI